MKKPNRPFEWEDEKDSSSKFEFDLEDADDGEIIELDEVVELQGDSMDDDDLGGEIEILDADGDLDLEDFGKPESDTDDILGDDFLKKLSDSESKKAPSEEKMGQDDIDSLLDFDEAITLGPEEDDEEIEAFILKEKARAATGPAGEFLPSVDGFVAQIEDRLLTAVRELVEAKLPEIVRDVLREEIERLKNESE